MSTAVDSLIADFCAQLNAAERYGPFVQRAEEVEHPNLARFFRALIACETHREELIRHGVVEHMDSPEDYYICPHCGLIVIPEPPERCPVDETPGEKFERV